MKKEDKITFENVSHQIDIDPWIVEKDYYEIQLVKLLKDIGLTVDGHSFDLVLGGGTSLSKCFKVIPRFSEDLDYRIVGTTQLGRNTRLQLKNQIEKHIEPFNDIYSIKKVEILNRNQTFKWEINYPTDYERPDNIRPHLQLEVTLSELKSEAMVQPMTTFVNEIMGQDPEITQLKCVSPVETASDKVAALSWRVNQRPHAPEKYDPTTIRHLFDLYFLSDSYLAKNEDAFIKMSRENVENDIKERLKVDVKVSDLLSQTLNLLQIDKQFEKDYWHVIGDTFYGKDADMPNYIDLLTKLEIWFNKIM